MKKLPTMFCHSFGGTISTCFVNKYPNRVCSIKINMANGRFLWRNRVGAENIEIQVKILNKGREKEWV